MKPVITTAMLNAKGACVSQIARFRMYFGDKVEVTIERAVEHADHFEWEWAIANFLPEEVGERIAASAIDVCIEQGGINYGDALYDKTLARMFAEAYINEWSK